MNQKAFVTKIKALGKDVFGIHDVKTLFPEEANYINTILKRLKEAGVVAPVTRGLYRLADATFEIERVATTLSYPSYISFESALSKYGIINQGLFGLTLATTKHSKRLRIGGVICEYRRLKYELFFGFNLLNGIYIAEPEKALLDTLYLIALGKKQTSYKEWHTSSLNKVKLINYSQAFGKKVAQLAKEITGI